MSCDHSLLQQKKLTVLIQILTKYTQNKILCFLKSKSNQNSDYRWITKQYSGTVFICRLFDTISMEGFLKLGMKPAHLLMTDQRGYLGRKQTQGRRQIDMPLWTCSSTNRYKYKYKYNNIYLSSLHMRFNN